MKYLIYAAIFALILWSCWYLVRRIRGMASGKGCACSGETGCDGSSCEGCAYARSCDKLGSTEADRSAPPVPPLISDAEPPDREPTK